MERAPPPTAAGEPTVVKPTRDPDRGKGRALAFDIVAILDPFSDQTSQDIEDCPKQYWLQRCLPEAFPYARIVTFGDAHQGSLVSKPVADIGDYHLALLIQLSKLRHSTGTDKRPFTIMFHNTSGIKMLSCFMLALSSLLCTHPALGELTSKLQGIVCFENSDNTRHGLHLGHDRSSQFIPVECHNVSRSSFLREMVRLSNHTVPVTVLLDESSMHGPYIRENLASCSSFSLLFSGLKQAYPNTKASQARVVGEIRRLLPEPADIRVIREQGAQFQCFKRWLSPRKGLFERSSPTGIEENHDWFFQHETYRAWIENDTSTLLWIHGNPGSGKTTLIKYFINEFQRNSNGLRHSSTPVPQRAIVAAIVCDFRYVLTRDEGSAKGLLLRTLLYQILESNPSILSCLQTSLKVTSPLPERPEDLEDHHYERWLVKALIAASMNARVFIVIDGLDECTYAVQNDILAWIELFCTATSLHPRPRIVVTSRRERPIKQVRQGYPTKRIHVGEQNTQAIAKYCSAMLYSRLAEPVPSMVTRDVRDSLDIVVAELTTRAKGIFLWASLAVDMLTRDFLARRGTFPDMEELRKALKDIPTGLDSLYECLLDRLCLSRRSKFLYVAAWILFAVRPLTLDELNTALQYDVSQPEHSAHDGVSLHGTSPPIMCKGLIEIAPDPLSDTKTVRLVHFTVKEYLLGAGARHVMSSGSANTRITEACVKHLDYCIGNRLRPNYPLFEYAVLHWRFHAEIGDTGGIAQDCLIEAFQWPSLDRISCWSTVYQQLRFPNAPSRSPKRTSLLHVASQYGLRNTIQTLRVKDTLEVLLNAIDDVGYTPLHLACKLGHVDTVSILLSFGADTQATDQDNYTPLHIAARYGHLEVVRLLLAEQNPESFKASHESALYCAVRNGNIDIVKFLIERGADPNCLDRQGNSILTLAASLGNEAVAELALSLENTKWPPSNYGIALVFAAAFGLSGLARSLLHLDETLEHRTPILQQTLITAITYTSEEIADILLVPGCDPNVTNGHDHQHGQSALSMAAASGSERMVNLLLRRGANPNIRDIHTQCTPVIHAITHGQPAIVGLLISHGACIEPKGEYMLGNQSWIFRILTALFIQCANGKGKTDGEGRGGGRQKDERSSKQGTPGSSGRKQGRNPPSGGNGKRKHSDRSSDEDEDYKDQHPSKKEQKIDFPCACPFQAAFPEDHDCLEYTNVARLKEHIHRVHAKKWCRICWTEVENEDDGSHNGHCAGDRPRDFSKGISLAQQEQLRSRKGLSKMSAEQQWHHVFRIVLPEHEGPIPSSSYTAGSQHSISTRSVEQRCRDSSLLEKLRKANYQHCPCELSRLVHEHYRSHERGTTPVENDHGIATIDESLNEVDPENRVTHNLQSPSLGLPQQFIIDSLPYVPRLNAPSVGQAQSDSAIDMLTYASQDAGSTRFGTGHPDPPSSRPARYLGGVFGYHPMQAQPGTFTATNSGPMSTHDLWGPPASVHSFDGNAHGTAQRGFEQKYIDPQDELWHGWDSEQWSGNVEQK